MKRILPRNAASHLVAYNVAAYGCGFVWWVARPVSIQYWRLYTDDRHSSRSNQSPKVSSYYNLVGTLGT
jgi:hypothetical protein